MQVRAQPRESFPAGALWDASIISRPDTWHFAIPPTLLESALDSHTPDFEWSTIIHSDVTVDAAGAHAAFFRRVEQAMTQGPGFVVLSRIPIESLSFREARLLHTLLAKRFGRLHAQDATGSYLCDVIDPDLPDDATIGGQIALGRRWNDLPCHTDHAFGRDPPRRLAFLCFRAAAAGGAVRLASAATLLERVTAMAPGLVEYLRLPVPFDARRQIDADDEALDAVAILDSDAQGTRLRYLHHQIALERLDRRQREAVDALEATLADPDVVAELRLSPGDVLLIDNRLVLHGRGAYRNNGPPGGPRHHLRLWLI
jgi:alpha-ketoglutarate-dependent taurine dioxygenase